MGVDFSSPGDGNNPKNEMPRLIRPHGLNFSVQDSGDRKSGPTGGGGGSGTPVLYYDGNCGFCRRWVGWVRRRGGDRLTYVPWTHAPAIYQTTPNGESRMGSVMLASSEGQIDQGMKAVYMVLSLLGTSSFLKIYQANRVFSILSEWVYTCLSRCRPALSRLLDVAFGPPPEDL